MSSLTHDNVTGEGQFKAATALLTVECHFTNVRVPCPHLQCNLKREEKRERKKEKRKKKKGKICQCLWGKIRLWGHLIGFVDGLQLLVTTHTEHWCLISLGLVVWFTTLILSNLMTWRPLYMLHHLLWMPKFWILHLVRYPCNKDLLLGLYQQHNQLPELVNHNTKNIPRSYLHRAEERVN